MTEPAAALDVLIQRLRAYTNRDADPGCSIDDPECCRACLELHAADTLAAQAAQLAEVTAERDTAFIAGMTAKWNGKAWEFNPACRVEGAIAEAFAAFRARAAEPKET